MAAENVTAAFSAFIEALPAGTLAGRSVLIADDCFPSLHFLLSELAERIGFTLVTVRTRPGGIGVEEGDFLATWDARVALDGIPDAGPPRTEWLARVRELRAAWTMRLRSGRPASSKNVIQCWSV